MADMSDIAIQKAEARGKTMLASEPRASAAHYEPVTGRIVIDLVNGCGYAFPAALVQDLQGASPADLAGVRVDGLGFNLHFSSLDVDLYVPDLVAGIFGTRVWMARGLTGVADRAKAAAPRAKGEHQRTAVGR